MADKTKTQEDQLDETFGSYETEMADEETQSFTKEKTPKKKGSNQNKIIIGVLFLVAVLWAIWQFVLPKGSAPKPIAQTTPSNTQVNPNVPSNVSQNISQSVGQPVTPNVGTPVGTPVNNTAGTTPGVNDFLNNQPTPSTNIAITVPEQSAQQPAQVLTIQTPEITATPTAITTVTPTVNPSVTPSVVPTVNPTVNAVTPTVSTTTGDNADLLSGIKNYFDNKLDTIQRNTESQGRQVQDIRMTVDQLAARISDLEKGKRSDPVKTVEVREVKKPAVAKPRVREVRVITETRVEPKIVDSERVIAVKPVRGVSDEQVVVSKRVRPPVTGYKVHSLFNGRVWIEGGDNTHKSFSVGDTLPQGEIIKDIDMEKQVIVTDRGTISAR